MKTFCGVFYESYTNGAMLIRKGHSSYDNSCSENMNFSQLMSTWVTDIIDADATQSQWFRNESWPKLIYVTTCFPCVLEIQFCVYMLAYMTPNLHHDL